VTQKPRIAIVGGVAGGASCAARARRLDEGARITVYERGPYVSFANCGLPYYVGGEIPERDSLLVSSPESLRQTLNIEVHTHTEVVAIDRHRREIEVRHTPTGRVRREGYDALVLATGAEPLRPPIPGLERPGHFTVRSIPDVDRILSWLVETRAERAVVVGGGYIGLEMAEQLRRRHLQVALVEALPQVMSPLDPEMAALLHQELRAHGVELYLGDAVAAFEEPGPGETSRASTVVLRSGRRLPADLVILGLGVRPDVALARQAGLELGVTGGIRVDAHLRTSDPHIWAVGDAIEVPHAVTGAPSLIPLAGPANRQGRIAADNILGRPSRYPGTLGTAILRLFTLTAACTGANEQALRQAGIPYQALHLHPKDHAGYFPGARTMALKILFHPTEGRLLGAQAVGPRGVDKRIDVLATALRARMTVDDLVDLELAYAPPFGSAKDPVNLAGMAAQNLRTGLVEAVQWHDLPREALLLDVRSPEEVARGAIPGAVHIPLPQLRQRLQELPAGREIVVYCASGQRSYYACRILLQHGFKARNLSGSYQTWRAALADRSAHEVTVP
jgi:NADPH-dependent 2,4-dienoyl-CoA reductase/sulfur reductase-like enzyme/rhodanese-related sulfurtransferase